MAVPSPEPTWPPHSRALGMVSSTWHSISLSASLSPRFQSHSLSDVQDRQRPSMQGRVSQSVLFLQGSP